jgi:hypothetical protein
MTVNFSLAYPWPACQSLDESEQHTILDGTERESAAQICEHHMVLR